MQRGLCCAIRETVESEVNMPALKYLDTLSSEDIKELNIYTEAIICRLKYEREKRNLSKIAVGKETGISGYHNMELEGKKNSFSFPILFRLAKFYGITIEELIDKNNIYLSND